MDDDGLRYLLGDMSGRLFMLFLANQTTPDGAIEVKDLKVELLGEVIIFNDPFLMFTCHFFFFFFNLHNFREFLKKTSFMSLYFLKKI